MTAGGQLKVALSPDGWLWAMRGALADVVVTTSKPADPGVHYDPMSDLGFTVVRKAIRYTWAVAYPLETYGLSTACSGGELARASGGVPVRGCSPSPLSSSIRQG